MKRNLFLIALPLIFTAFTLHDKTELTPAERKFAIDHLNKTRTELIASVRGLSETQLNYKPSPDRWSVLECVQHITLASQGIFGFMQQTLKTSGDSALKPNVTDDEFIRSVEDRSRKAQAPEPLRPSQSSYKDLASTLKAFNAERDSLINYINSANDDFRSHVADMGFAKVDAFQIILLISAHTSRHTKQLNEIKADAGFPGK